MATTETSAQDARFAGDEDLVWQSIREAATEEAAGEPMLASFLHATILNHKELEDAVSFHLAPKLATTSLPSMLIREVIDAAFSSDPRIGRAIRDDICAVRDRDPATSCCLVPLLYLKGVHSLIAHRVSHWLWREGRKSLALYLQNRISEVFGVDVHPAARVGKGIFIDHATSVVIGETAVVEDNVSMLHEVTLGGTGKISGDRHPKVRHGVMIGAGAKILGNVEVGEGAKVGAGSVVLDDVPPHHTVAGVPAKIVGRPEEEEPALEMDQRFTHSHSHGSGI